MKQLERCSGRGFESPHLHHKEFVCGKESKTFLKTVGNLLVKQPSGQLIGSMVIQTDYDGDALGFDRANSKEVDNLSEKT